MKFANVLNGATEFLAAFKLGGARNDRQLGVLDFGILEVAMMVAALDGAIRPEELTAYRRLAAGCRGYTARGARQALDASLRKAGYVLALAQTGIYPDSARTMAFVEEALRALPNGFADGDLRDLRRAFVLWMAVAVSDGEYSGIERAAIGALRAKFATIRGRRQLLPDDFFVRVETLVKALGVPSRQAAAESELRTLIVDGTVAS